MRLYNFLIILFLLVIMTTGVISAADNATQHDLVSSDDSSDLLISENNNLTSSSTENNLQTSYDNKYYLFRGDCWTIKNNFESSAAITSENHNDLTVTGTFRTENDIVGLYWNSTDLIQHPYISYGNRSDYTDVILQFDYITDGCKDLSSTTLTVAANTGETYFLSMNRFIENGHVIIDFNNMTLLPGNSYIDRNNNPITVSQETPLDVSNLKYLMFTLVPTNFVEDYTKYTIMENANFTFKISNITVTNGEICDEQPALEPHQYRLCEGYDDSYNLNPLRLTKEMKKLGYADWVDLYIGASYFYEKNGTVGDVITELKLNNSRTEKMVLDKNVPLNSAFRAWLDCYSRELKNNGVQHLVISVSMENLQCPQSWRQMDANGNFAMSGWEPETFFYSPCNDEVVLYMKNVSESCLDIVVANGLQPILQMGETWWWWNETSPYFYDDSTKAKYFAEFGKELPEYTTRGEHDENVTAWLNQQLVHYIGNVSSVVKGDKYTDGISMALFYPSSVADSENIPEMIIEVNYLKDAYSPNMIDILQIEDYDWVIGESTHHEKAYTIGQELGFNEDHLQYFGGFVQNPENATKYWELIQNAMDEALEKNFNQVYVWAGLQVRRDNKILGYDEYAIIHNLELNNVPGILSPIITSLAYASAGENFTISMRTNDWANGYFNIYDYNNGQKGGLIASNSMVDGSSSVVLSSAVLGLNKFYLEFDYGNGKYHLIHSIQIIENSQNITADVSREVETGHKANVTFNAPESLNSPSLYISVDGNAPTSHLVEHGEVATTISDLSDGYHTVLLYYNDGYYSGDRLVGEIYYKTFTVKVGIKLSIETHDVTADYNSGECLVVTLKDSAGNLLKGKDIVFTFNGSNQTITTDNNGNASLSLQDVLPNNYTAEIFFAGDDIYLSSSASANIVINKLSTSLSADNVTFIYDTPTNLIITLKDKNNVLLKGKEISVSLNGDHRLTTDNNGQATLPIDSLPGNYTAEISFAEDSIYLSSSASAKIQINKISTTLTSNDLTFVYDEPTNLTVTLKDRKDNLLKGKEIIITLDGKNHTLTTDNNGQARLPVDSLPGNYTAQISFKEDNVYLSSSASSNIKINKIATNLASNNVTFVYDDPTNLTITLKDRKDNLLKGKEILVTLDGKNHTLTTDNMGEVRLPIDSLPGNYTAQISFKEDNIYLSSFASSNIKINKIATNLTSNNITFIYDDPTNLTATLKDRKGNLLKGKEILVTLDGKNHTLTTDSNGQVTLPVDSLPGNYTAQISFAEDNIYLSSFTQTNITINKISTNITSNNITFVYDDPTNLTATLKDRKDNLLIGKEILVTLDGKNHTLTTNNNGQVTLPIDSLPGNYTAEISFKEDTIYLSSSSKVNITVTKIPTSLVGEDISFIYDNPTNLTVTLKDRKDNLLKGKDVLITLDGKNHTLTTDNNGQVTLAIDSLPGNYTAEISFKEDTIYLSSSSKVNISVNKIATSISASDISFIYDDPKNLTVTLKDRKDNLLKGKDVLVTLDGNHTLTTDNNGQVTLAIDSLPGNYTAKISFTEDNIYLSSYAQVNVTVNKIATSLDANDITFIYDDPANLIVTLKDRNNNILKGKMILITLDGKNHKLTTDDMGQATLTIDSLPGNYTAKISFAEDNIYLSSSAQVNVVVNKIATSLSASDISFIYDDLTNLTVTLKDRKDNLLADKEIIVNLDGKNHKITTDIMGQATLAIDLLPGKYTAGIIFLEDKIYLASSTHVNIQIGKIATSLETFDISFVYDEPTNLTAILKDRKNNLLEGKDIIVTLDGRNHTITTDNRGHATLAIDSLPGNYTAQITFNEDIVYLSSSASADIQIGKIATSLETFDISFIYDEPRNLTVTLKDRKDNLLAGKDIIVNLDGKNHTITTDNNGQATLAIDSLPGNYDAEIIFNEDNIYLSSSASADIQIGKIATSLETFDISFIYDEPTNLTVTLKDRKDNLLKGKEIIVTLDGKNHTITTNDKGQATLAIDSLPGNYSAQLEFMEDNVYLSSSASADIQIGKITTSLVADDISFIYDDPINLTVTLKDRKDNLLVGKEIIVNLDGKNHKITTDNKGQATLYVDSLPGFYTAQITFNEDNIYLSSSASADIQIGKIATSLVADDISFVYDEPTNLIVILKDRKDNLLKGKEISVTLDGKNHTLTSDDKGQISLPVDSLPGNYTAQITFNEDNIYLSSSADVNITVYKITTLINAPDVTAEYCANKNLVITLKDTKSNVLAGKNITITLNNKVYVKQTDANGQVKLPIDLAVNKYDAKITFAGDEIYKSSVYTAKITIKKSTPTITASSKTFKLKLKTKKVTATIKNKNKPVKSVILQLTVNKKTYKAKTDSKGLAIFKINLTKKGKYSAVIKYSGNNNYNKASKKITVTIK